MRIALVHSFYVSSSPSGENEVVLAERDALRAAGHEVRLFSRSSDEGLAQPLYRLRSAARVITGHGDDPAAEVAAFGPDVVHVHNLFPNFSRAWLRPLRVPFVHTMHNFRAFCASSDHYRAGGVCHACTDTGSWNAVRYGCYHDSAVASVPLAIRTGLGIGRDPLFTQAARVIALSEQMRTELLRAGMDPSRVVRWPNFLPDALDPRVAGHDVPGRSGRCGHLFVGRLDDAKGVLELVRGWPAGRRLTIVGSGPRERDVAEAGATHPDVEILGRVPREEVIARMLQSESLVVPSRWYEGFPLVYPEALSCGLAVLATDPSSIAQQVADDGTGRRFPDVGSLVAAVDGGTLGLPGPGQVRAVFDRQYTEERYRARARALYEGVVATPARTG